MELLVRIGNLGDVVELRGAEHARERFITHTIDPSCQLLDAHHGEPVAGLSSTWTDSKGTTYGRFQVHPGMEQQAAAMRSRSLSLEFTSEREVRSDATFDGGSVLEHRSAVVLAVAATPSPARADARVLLVEDAPVQTRSAKGVPAVLADRLAGRRCYGSTAGAYIESVTQTPTAPGDDRPPSPSDPEGNAPVAVLRCGGGGARGFRRKRDVS